MSDRGSPFAALRRAVPLLRCPVCAAPVEAVEVVDLRGAVASTVSADPATPVSDMPLSGVRCTAGHLFDRARQGQLTLFGPRGRRFPGDSMDQVVARERVLGSGAYDPVAELLARIACEEARGINAPVILEAGAGTGFYLARVLEALRGAEGAPALDAAPGPLGTAPGPLGIGTEISVPAARRLAKSSTDVAALVADTWDGLPLADASVDLIQVVFAPRNAAEFARVLAPGGTLVVAGPGQGHLEPLRTAAGMLTPESDKADRLGAGLAGLFTPGDVHLVDTTLTVPDVIAVDLALMGPSGVHLDRDELERNLGGRDHEVRVHVEVRTFRVKS